mgnify:FL=1
MKNSKKVIASVLSLSMGIGILGGASLLSDKKAEAVNPIVQDVYTADPAPMVCSDGKVYVYTSHDEDVTVNNFFSMNDWKCYSTTDMVNWTDHGTVLSWHEFDKWAKDNSSWACQCVERNGKFYMYVPINAKNGTTAIGVAVSDSPTGPFTDPLGEPLVGPAPNYIDPTVWVDTDGQAYLYWGNPDLYCVKLNEDMISYDKDLNEDGFVKGIKRWDLETNDFKELAGITNEGGRIADGSYADDVSDACRQAQSEFGVGVRVDNNKVRRPTLYEEGPWFYGRNGHYYMVYAANGIPERIDYSMSDSPLGPWEYKGIILEENMEDGKGTGSFTNHAGVIDYKGHSYIFYHTGKLPGGGGYKRSVAVEEITYNEDGTINTAPMTADGVEAVEGLNPYQRVEAETIAYGKDVEKEDRYKGDDTNNQDRNLCDISNGDYIQIKNVDFTNYGAVAFEAMTSSDVTKGETAGHIELHLDAVDGEMLADYVVKGSGSFDTWTSDKVDIDKSKATGEHDLFMVFKGDADKEELFKFDYWQFTQMELPATPAPTPTSVPTAAPAVTPAATAAPVQTAAVTATASPQAKAPAKVKLSKVKAGKGKITLKIKKIKSAAGYRIAYSTNKNFRKAVKMIVTKKNTVTIKKLKRRKTYYVRAQAYVNNSGRKVYGRYGTKVKVKVR